MNHSADGQTLEYQQTVLVVEPSAESRQEVRILRRDWLRIKRLLEKASNSSPRASEGWHYTLFGIALTCFITLITVRLSSANPVSDWFYPTFIIATISTMLLGVILAFLYRKDVKRRRDDIADILDEMREVEGTFGSIVSFDESDRNTVGVHRDS